MRLGHKRFTDGCKSTQHKNVNSKLLQKAHCKMAFTAAPRLAQ